MSEVSQRQLEANRQNAKLGGVKTEEGKTMSKYNALKHGILSQEVLFEGDDENSLVELGRKLRAELKPETELELLLVDRITANFWRLRRVLEVERNRMEWRKEYKDIGFEYGAEKESEAHKLKQESRKKASEMIINNGIDQILRYETAIERSIYRALHELQRIQAAINGEKPPLPLALDVIIDQENEEKEG